MAKFGCRLLHWPTWAAVLKKAFHEQCESCMVFSGDALYPMLGGAVGCSQPTRDVASVEEVLLGFSSPAQAIWGVIFVVEAFMVGCKVSVAGPGLRGHGLAGKSSSGFAFVDMGSFKALYLALASSFHQSVTALGDHSRASLLVCAVVGILMVFLLLPSLASSSARSFPDIPACPGT